jgi:UDP-glucose 4-epimerase
MKILVSGGAGFIASHVVDAYIGEGHQVTVIDDLSSGTEENINSQAEFIKIDIRDEDVEKYFISGRFDVLNRAQSSCRPDGCAAFCR